MGSRLKFALDRPIAFEERAASRVGLPRRADPKDKRPMAPLLTCIVYQRLRRRVAARRANEIPGDAGESGSWAIDGLDPAPVIQRSTPDVQQLLATGLGTPFFNQQRADGP